MIDIATRSLSVSTKGFTDIIDITAELQTILSDSGFEEGNIMVFVSGSTAGLTTIEYEGGLKKDLKEFFEKWIPMNERYYHNERWHDGNGYAHLRASLLKPSLAVPFTNRQLCLGTWQQVILVDFDNRPRRRELVVQINGKKP
ncbi:MAG: YjbQ family protein [Calditrichaceae bacterium]|nr:secondary thiamine-phosphate synthase enzyme YjbQ [Calditrichia bacterium]NUQ43039.1 YjbQ family protein [Calditrichaceae bacterium]